MPTSLEDQARTHTHFGTLPSTITHIILTCVTPLPMPAWSAYAQGQSTASAVQLLLQVASTAAAQPTPGAALWGLSLCDARASDARGEQVLATRRQRWSLGVFTSVPPKSRAKYDEFLLCCIPSRVDACPVHAITSECTENTAGAVTSPRLSAARTLSTIHCCLKLNIRHPMVESDCNCSCGSGELKMVSELHQLSTCSHSFSAAGAVAQLCVVRLLKCALHGLNPIFLLQVQHARSPCTWCAMAIQQRPGGKHRAEFPDNESSGCVAGVERLDGVLFAARKPAIQKDNIYVLVSEQQPANHREHGLRCMRCCKRAATVCHAALWP